jgi:hypothetical protein
MFDEGAEHAPVKVRNDKIAVDDEAGSNHGERSSCEIDEARRPMRRAG